MRKRLRSAIKWGGTVLTVLLLVVWVGSAWWAAGLRLKPISPLKNTACGITNRVSDSAKGVESAPNVVFQRAAMVHLDVWAGRVFVVWDEPWSIIPVDISWYPPEQHSSPFSWWFDKWRSTGAGGVRYTGAHIPTWVLVVLVAMPTLGLWRCDRRRQPGLCIKCGYDLRGNESEVCPECGSS